MGEVPAFLSDHCGELHRCVLYIRADFVLLARYMQILSHEFLSQYSNRTINIYDSFFAGHCGQQASSYRRAYLRGVKLIGATGHYVREVRAERRDGKL